MEENVLFYIYNPDKCADCSSIGIQQRVTGIWDENIHSAIFGTTDYNYMDKEGNGGEGH